MGRWEKLHSEELHNYTLHQISLESSNQGGCRTDREDYKCIKDIIGMLYCKITLERPSHKCENHGKVIVKLIV
jgi:hypothetical protein